MQKCSFGVVKTEYSNLLFSSLLESRKRHPQPPRKLLSLKENDPIFVFFPEKNFAHSLFFFGGGGTKLIKFRRRLLPPLCCAYVPVCMRAQSWGDRQDSPSAQITFSSSKKLCSGVILLKPPYFTPLLSGEKTQRAAAHACMYGAMRSPSELSLVAFLIISS